MDDFKHKASFYLLPQGMSILLSPENFISQNITNICPKAHLGLLNSTAVSKADVGKHRPSEFLFVQQYSTTDVSPRDKATATYDQTE